MSVLRGVLACLLLLLGIAVYAHYRPEAVLYGFWIENPMHVNRMIPDWVVYSLPDALWYAALLVLQPKGWWKNFPSVEGFLTIMAILLPFLHEGMQFFGIMPGTFCSTDILVYFITLITYITIWIYQNVQSGWHK